MNARARHTVYKTGAPAHDAIAKAARLADAAPTRDAIAEAAAEAANLANTAPAHAREFWRRLAGSLRKAATIPR